MKNFAELTEREVLAVAISSEEEDSRIYMTFAEDLAERYPDSAKVFEEMAEEEIRHRGMLFDLYRTKFGEYLPLVRRQDVKGFVRHKSLWLMHPLGLDEVADHFQRAPLALRRPPTRQLPGHSLQLRFDGGGGGSQQPRHLLRCQGSHIWGR